MAHVHPITRTDVASVAGFLHRQLNGRLSASDWEAAITPPWMEGAPNHGFMLISDDDRVLGAYLAFYSTRLVEKRSVRFCNLAAWCVLEEHRAQGLRLLRAMLAQPGYVFTDLSPSGNVIELNRRLKFALLAGETALVPNLPWPIRSRRVKVLRRPDEIEGALDGPALEIFRDHANLPGAMHVAVQTLDGTCHVMYRRDRRKDLPLFGTILYVSNPEVFRVASRSVYRHMLMRGRIVLTLAESRIVGRLPRLSVRLQHPRPKMYRGSDIPEASIDYLYSELTCVAW